MRSGNPAFKNTPFTQPGAQGNVISGANIGAISPTDAAVMTVRGTAMKTVYLLLIAVVTAAFSWNYFSTNPGAIFPTMIGAIIGTLVTGFVIRRTPKIAHFVVPLFAFAEGLLLAAFSVAVIEFSSLSHRLMDDVTLFNTLIETNTTESLAQAAPMLAAAKQEGFVVVGQAAGLTFAIAASVLIGYGTGLLRLGGFAKKMIIVMTAGVMIYYMLGFVVNMIAGDGIIPNLGMSASPIGIGFSFFVVILASFNLLMDFQLVDEGAKRGMPKHYEWIGAFGILVTLVWLYIELLRLLMKLRSHD